MIADLAVCKKIMARMSRQVPVDFSHFGVTSVLERLLTSTSDIEEVEALRMNAFLDMKTG